MEPSYAVAGMLTGVVVGLTGIGGGALMTPILIFVFGVAPATAVGTDLLFATLTKLVAVRLHGARGTIDWAIVGKLAAGSIPAAAIVLVVLHAAGGAGAAVELLIPALALALIATAIALLFKGRVHQLGRRLRLSNAGEFRRLQPPLTVAAGAVIGALVTLTSIGAGALGTVMLVCLYPLRLTPPKLVATDLAHAVPVAVVAGLGHLALGNIDFALLGWLLVGSIPGVWIGTLLSIKAPEGIVRHAIAAALLFVGARLLI